jgi:hypothetical protein
VPENRKKASPTCATCPQEMPNMLCMHSDGSGHKGCPTLTRKELLTEANQEYENSETSMFARQASIQ